MKLKRELIEQRLMREKGILSNLKELGDLKEDLSPEKYAAIEKFVSAEAAHGSRTKVQSDFWWRFKWAAAVGFVITGVRYSAALLLEGAEGFAPNAIMPQAAVMPQSMFPIVGMLVGILLIPIATGFFVGRYPAEDRNLPSLAVLASLVSLAIPFAFAIIVLVPVSLML